MPSPYRTKVYLENSIYHIFNRGVNKQHIFHSKADYVFYLMCLKEYLLPKSVIENELRSRQYKKTTLSRKLHCLGYLRNYSDEIELLAYCLMPNHIHLLVKQKPRDAISRFMQSLHTRYKRQHALKHGSVGPLFQGRYKAKVVVSDEYLFQVVDYIHKNPKNICKDYRKYPWSSARYYLSARGPAWLKRSETKKRIRT